MKDYSLYEKAWLQDKAFPVRAFRFEVPDTSPAFHNHWHEQMEILYFLNGKGVVECNSQPNEVKPGDILFINSNELHYGYCIEKPLSYYCIIFDASLLKGSFDGNCEQKYITPMSQNLIVFRNKIANDPEILECILTIMKETDRASDGYELFIKAAVYRLLGLLFRNHMEKLLTEKEYRAQTRNLERLNKVLEFIEENYPEPITLDQLSSIACLSRYHFCHLFKSLTGKGATEYVNALRVDKAEMMLKNTSMSITEIAMATGFCDANYFSRTFSRYKAAAPSAMRKA